MAYGEVIITPEKVLCSDYERAYISKFNWTILTIAKNSNKSVSQVEFTSYPFLEPEEIQEKLDMLYDILMRISERHKYVGNATWEFTDDESYFGSTIFENVVVEKVFKDPKHNAVYINIESD